MERKIIKKNHMEGTSTATLQKKVKEIRKSKPKEAHSRNEEGKFLQAPLQIERKILQGSLKLKRGFQREMMKKKEMSSLKRRSCSLNKELEK